MIAPFGSGIAQPNQQLQWPDHGNSQAIRASWENRSDHLNCYCQIAGVGTIIRP